MVRRHRMIEQFVEEGEGRCGCLGRRSFGLPRGGLEIVKDAPCNWVTKKIKKLKKI